jgi:hypothetical protein
MAAGQRADGEGTIGGRILAGTVAGIAGGLVFWSLMMAMHAGPDRLAVLKMAAFPWLGDRALQPGADLAAVALGGITHLAVSSLWGVLFALLVQRASRPATVVLGLLWGVVAWLAMFTVVLPRVARPLAEGGGSMGTMMIHLFFGLAVGVALCPFQHARPEEAGWSWHGRAAPV